MEPALRSADAEERRGGRYVLEMFSRRGDLYADVDRTLAQMDLADHDKEPRRAQGVAADVHEEQSSTPPEAPAEGRGNLLADPQWVDAMSAFFAERWAEAVERFETLQASYPGEGRVETRLKEARRQRDIDAWSSRAEASAAERDWDIVVTALENLTALDPANPDVGARLEQARMAQRRKALVDEMTALHQAGRWNAVVAAARELARIDPDNSDPGGIVSDAQAKIREAELADRYAQALNHLDQEQWQHAADLLAAIEQEQPGYRDAAALLRDSPTETTRDSRSYAAGYPTSPAITPDDDPSAAREPLHRRIPWPSKDAGKPAAGLSPPFSSWSSARGGLTILAVVQSSKSSNTSTLDLDINVHGNHFGSLGVRSGVGSRTRRSATTSRKTTSRRRRSPPAHRARRRSTSQFPRAGHGFPKAPTPSIAGSSSTRRPIPTTRPRSSRPSRS